MQKLILAGKDKGYNKAKGDDMMKEKIVQFIRKIISQNNYRGALVGISGGIDSAVVGALCVEALGKDKVFGLLLPERDSAPETLLDYKLVCDFLGIKYKIRSITPTLKTMGVYSMENNYFFLPYQFKKRVVSKRWNVYGNSEVYLNNLNPTYNPQFLKDRAYYRVKHRIRMCYLYLEAEKRGYAVVGTTNKTELETGFYVKWGDEAVDLEPIIHLYKYQVYELAKELQVPDKIIKKPPSPDLLPGVTDEAALGLTYADLDRILVKLNQGQDLENEDPEKVKRVKEIIESAGSRRTRIFSLDDSF